MSIYFKNDLSFNFIYNKKKKMVKIPAYKLIKDIAQYVKIVYNLPRDSKVFLYYNNSNLNYYQNKTVGIFFKQNKVFIKVEVIIPEEYEENKLKCHNCSIHEIKYFCRDCNLNLCDQCKSDELYFTHKFIPINLEELLNGVYYYIIVLQNEINEKKNPKLNNFYKDLENLSSQINDEFNKSKKKMNIDEFMNYFNILKKEEEQINEVSIFDDNMENKG